MADNNRFRPGDRPYVDSIVKIGRERVVTALDASVPTVEAQGISVRDWSWVEVTVHPHTPLLSLAPAGWKVTVRPWHFKYTASAGETTPTGQWFSGSDFEVGLDGDASAGPMSTRINVHTTDKLWLQVVDMDGAPAAWDIRIGMYGVSRIDEGGFAVNASITGSVAGDVDVKNLFESLAHEDYLYSNYRGDFTAAFTTATTLTLTGLPFSMQAGNVVAVGVKEAGTTDWTIRYRGYNLSCAWNQGTSVLTVGGFTFAATQEILVWLEGPAKTIDQTALARRVKVANPDALNICIDGLFVDASVSDNDPQALYYPFNMTQDGYYYLSAQLEISYSERGLVNVTLEGTDDLANDGAELWYDITQMVFGVSTIDYSNYATIPLQSLCSIGFRRLRWCVVPPPSGGPETVTIYQARSAYGNGFTQQIQQGQPVAGTGTPIMFEAKDFDGAVLPNAVDEGDAARGASTLYGIPYAFLVNETGAATPVIAHDAIISAANGGTVGLMAMAEAKDFTGAALSNVSATGDGSRIATNLYGCLFNFLVTRDGSGTPTVEHDEAIADASGNTAVLMQGLGARSSQLTAVANNDAVRAVANLYGEQVSAAHTWTTQSDRMEEVDPIDLRDIGEVHASITPAVTLAQGATVDYWIDMTHKQFFSMQFIDYGTVGAADSNWTVKVYASLQDDGTAIASRNYIDVTNAWFAAGSFITTCLNERDTPAQVKSINIEITRTAGTGTGTYALFTRKCY